MAKLRKKGYAFISKTGLIILVVVALLAIATIWVTLLKNIQP